MSFSSFSSLRHLRKLVRPVQIDLVTGISDTVKQLRHGTSQNGNFYSLLAIIPFSISSSKGCESSPCTHSGKLDHRAI